jgi:hypothetical protein
MSRAEFTKECRRIKRKRERVAAMEAEVAAATEQVLTKARDDEAINFSIGQTAEMVGITRSTAYDVYLKAPA